MIWQFAWRYFKGKKSTQAIQIISWVSVLAMAVGTAALIIVLSVFNGFESTIKNLYSDYHPDIKITATQGKEFTLNDTLWNKLKSIKGVQYLSKSLEENVLLNSDENQAIVTLKGIDVAYESVTHFKKNIQYGKVNFDSVQEFPPLAIGLQVSNKLMVTEESHFPINCYVFKKNANISFDPTQIYNSQLFAVNALFVMPEIDNDYAFASLNLVQELTEKYNTYSSIEIKLEPKVDGKLVKETIQKMIEPFHLKAENRLEQNKTLFFILKSEGWAVYAILTMMLMIASFNIIGSLSMLVIEKEKDIAILKTLGMPKVQIKKIFLATGVLISMIGALIGCALALLICWIQIRFGVVKMGDSNSFVIEDYPVSLKYSDFLLVMITVIIIAIIASWVPAVKASNKPIELRVR